MILTGLNVISFSGTHLNVGPKLTVAWKKEVLSLCLALYLKLIVVIVDTWNLEDNTTYWITKIQ